MASGFQPIEVTVSASADQFDSTIQSVKKGISSLKGIAGNIPLLGGAIGGFAAVTSVKAFESMYKETSDAILSNNREAQKLGVTYGELIGLQLRAGPAADQMAQGLSRFNKELGLAAQGNEESIKKLRGAGLEGAIGKPPIEAYKQLADQIQRAANPAEKMAILSQAGIRGGADLVNTLFAKGSQGITDAQARGEKLGLGVSQEDINSLIDAKIATKDLELSWTGLKQKVTTFTAPAMKDAANMLAHGDTQGLRKIAAGWTFIASAPFTGFNKDKMKKSAEAINDAFGIFRGGETDARKEYLKGQQDQILSGSIDDLNKKLESEREMIGMTAKEKEVYALKTKGATDAQLEYTMALAKATDADNFTHSLQEANEAMELQIQLFQKFGQTAKPIEMERKGAKAETVEYAKELDKAHAAQQRIASIQDATMSPADTFRKGVKELNEADIKGGLTPELRAKRSVQLIQQLMQSQGGLQSPATALQGTGAAEDFAAQMKNLSTSPVFGATKEDVGKLLESIDLGVKRYADSIPGLIEAIKEAGTVEEVSF